MFKQLRITYLLESTELWGGVKVVLEQSELLSKAGHHVNLLSKDSGPTWYSCKVPIIQVSDFNEATIPASDIIVGTYWTTVRDAFSCNRGILVHLCQGYEGDYLELSHLKKDIEEVYSYTIPKITISKHLDNFLQQRFNSETYYVGQMLNKNIFFPNNKTNFLHAINFFGYRPLKIIVVGPFQVDFKNISTAIRGIVFFEKKFKRHIKVIRVSQFPLTQEEKEIRNPDKYLFHIPHYEMGNIYRESDIFISMSKEAEGFGLPALEAMACGIPTILSKISSYTSFDKIQDYSLFVDPFDHEVAARAIYEIYSDKSLRERLIARGLDVVSHFSSEALLKRLEDAFEKIIYKYKTKSLFNNQSELNAFVKHIL